MVSAFFKRSFFPNPISLILYVMLRLGETIFHNCNFCADRFSVSVALLMHKIQCHCWDSNGKPSSFDTFIAGLITEEKKHSSDANFNYTINITTSVTQTVKQCFVKAEPFIEMVSDDIDCIAMDDSEQTKFEQTFSQTSEIVIDRNKTLRF